MSKPRCLVAMSGGVDSSVAAALLQEEGYDCTGVTLKLLDEPASTEAGAEAGTEAATENSGACCGLNDVEDAKRVCARLGMPHYTLNYCALFTEQVIQPFVEAYLAGATPNPCIACNRHLKFDALLTWAQAGGFQCMATGHYARIKEGGLFQALDKAKDQSYVLYMLDARQLAFLRLPLGGYTKSQVRAKAEELGLTTSQKPESQDICFVPRGNYRALVEEWAGGRPRQLSEQTSAAGSYKVPGQPDAAGPLKLSEHSDAASPLKSPNQSPNQSPLKKGALVDTGGRQLGTHDGIHCFTIGQRRGIGIAGPEPLFVLDINPEKGEVVVGPERELGKQQVVLADVNLIDPSRVPSGMVVQACHRYHGRHPNAEVFYTNPKSIRIRYLEPQRDLARGQSLVLYHNEAVLGGGTIVQVA